MGLSLSAAEIAALERRTEGWIAGLQMAALAMGARGPEDQDGAKRPATPAAAPAPSDHLLHSAATFDRYEPPRAARLPPGRAVHAMCRSWRRLVRRTSGSGIAAVYNQAYEHSLGVVPLDPQRATKIRAFLTEEGLVESGDHCGARSPARARRSSLLSSRVLADRIRARRSHRDARSVIQQEPRLEVGLAFGFL